MNFLELKEKVYYEDAGTFRDVNVDVVDKDDWYKIIIFLSDNNIAYQLNNEILCKDLSISKMDYYFENEGINSISLHIFIWNIVLMGFFMVWKYDFLHITPEEINNELDLEVLYIFLAKISKLLNKKIYITPENSKNIVLDEINPTN